MSKSMKPVAGVPKPLTKEEKAQRMAAYLAQKKEQLFQGCLFSLLSNPKMVDGYNSALTAVDTANGLAEIAIKKMFNLDGKEGE